MYKDYAKLRNAIGAIQKSGTNPHFKNTYVELNTALQEIDKHLEANNFICFVQTPQVIEGKNYLNTKLIHSTGEFIESNLELITTKQDPQMLGSSLTYARRYSLLTMLGLQAVDDDGNEASGRTEPKKMITDEQFNKIVNADNIDQNAMLKAFKINNVKELTYAQATKIITDKGL